MRRTFIVVLALALASAVSSCKLGKTLASAVSFEGEIEMATISSFAAAATIKTIFAMKGTKMRTEMTGFGSYVTITDTETKKSFLIDRAAHTYSEMDLSHTKPAATTTPKAKAKANKTGRSETIAGHTCDVYEVDDPASAARSHVEMCMASGFTMLAMGLSGPFNALSSGDDAWSDVLSHGFPLRIEMRDASGASVMKVEATRIERKSLPDSDFAVPAGYTKTASPI